MSTRRCKSCQNLGALQQSLQHPPPCNYPTTNSSVQQSLPGPHWPPSPQPHEAGKDMPQCCTPARGTLVCLTATTRRGDKPRCHGAGKLWNYVTGHNTTQGSFRGFSNFCCLFTAESDLEKQENITSLSSSLLRSTIRLESDFSLHSSSRLPLCLLTLREPVSPALIQPTRNLQQQTKLFI